MRETEVRFKIDQKTCLKIKKSSELVREAEECIDIVFGYDGFDSLEKRGYIIRIRKKGNNVHLECKKRINEISWNEESITLMNIKQGYNFLTNMGMDPYLCIKRIREKRKINGAIIEIDHIDLLGDYVELELNGDYNFENIIKNFLIENEISDNRAPLYGDIFKKNIETNEAFKNKFLKLLEEVVNDL